MMIQMTTPVSLSLSCRLYACMLLCVIRVAALLYRELCFGVALEVL